MSAEEVRRCIVLSEGPRRNSSVTPDFVRLHDDKTTFTGAPLQLATNLYSAPCYLRAGMQTRPSPWVPPWPPLTHLALTC